jgi:hypothetical protein
MELIISTGMQYSRISDLPGSLKGWKEGETEDLLLALHAKIGEHLVEKAHDVINAGGWVADLITRVKADQMITDAVAGFMPDISLDEACSVALRVCGGCIEGAKPLRQEERTRTAGGIPTKRKLSNGERKSDMEEVSRKCQDDGVYAAGVSIGPLDMKLRNKQEPIFDGIAQGLLDKHFSNFFRRFPSSSLPDRP